MKGLNTLTPADIKNWAHDAQANASQGRVIRRIRLLADANPQWFAVEIRCETGQSWSLGDTTCSFPLMSVIKPFLLLYLLEKFGMQVFEWVGIEPSDAPFNSLEQLIADRGYPRNPMINSGAIALTDKLPGQNATDRCHQLCDWLNQTAGCQLKLDEAMLASVRSIGREPNQVLVRYLAQQSRLRDPDVALDTYEQICCLSGQVADLARLGELLAFDRDLINPHHRRTVNAIMLTCGLYEASAAFAVRIGLPMKSGISGGLVAVVPGEGAIACYSPALDSVGNPVAGLTFIEQLSQSLHLSLFG
ncbi:MAG: glutaminase [Cyanobacteria bacterium CRU_2_1]|nr:glutaminase [Cyanobacteria bacterium CRU_2_1]